MEEFSQLVDYDVQVIATCQAAFFELASDLKTRYASKEGLLSVKI